MVDGICRSAEFSPDREYRYSLIRTWDSSLPFVTFILINPSTADEFHDDPTNRRGICYAKDWGFGGVVFVNLFATRTKYIWEMKKRKEPVGPDNDYYIKTWCGTAGLVIAAWSKDGNHRGRDRIVKHNLMRVCSLHTLHINKDGSPGHILYLKKDLKPVMWRKNFNER